MTKALDLLGQVFDRLTVLERVGNTWKGGTQWRCKCICGNETIVPSDSLRSNNTRSCGCLQKEKFIEQHELHASQPIVEVKTCPDCNETKSVSDFYVNVSPIRVALGERVGYTRRCKNCSKLRQQARVHQISEEQYKERRQLSCEICGVYKEEPEKRGSGMHIDHDHATGELRGTLCDLCNRGLGLFSDDPIKLRQAANYIEKYRPSAILSRTETSLESVN